MTESLNDLTNEQLWKLFPIILEPHNPAWIEFYKNEEALIKEKIGTALNRISHIGSSCVPDLPAKPTVDILLEVEESCDIVSLKDNLISLGYIFCPKTENPPPHMMFMKGYTPEGFKGQAAHIHVRYRHDWDEFYFRDFLKMNRKTAEQYGLLKNDLMTRYRNNRDKYTDEKTDFIKQVTAEARKAFGSIYQ